jgi:hypothetical protein
MEGNGAVELGYNDGYHGDNSGAFQVTLTTLDAVAPALSVPTALDVAATSAGGRARRLFSRSDRRRRRDVPVACSPASGTTFPIGDTTVTCTATDAARNSTTRSFVVRARLLVGQPGAAEGNGSPASAAATLAATFARNRRARLTVGYGRRASIAGRLTNALGEPIKDAVVQVLDRDLRTGTSYAARGEVTTDAQGRFRLVPAAGTARAIRLEYRMLRSSGAPVVARAKVLLRVRAGATLTVAPERVRPGGTIRISGRLKGGPLPPSGKVVELLAFDDGQWRTFETVRTNRRARFAASYHFRNSRSGRSFQMRARIRRDDAYPYYLGYSNRVTVRVR